MKYLQYLYLIIGSVLAVTIHQYVTALASTKQGDIKPKNKGRLTLNPFSHMEPIGFICMIISGGYGWGKPVETTPVYYKDRKKGIMITYITPSIVNLIVGLIFALLSNIIMFFMSESISNSQDIRTLQAHLYLCFYLIANINVKFALFNIIPIYPLDAWKVLGVVVSPNTVVKLTSYEKMLQLLLMFMLVSGIVDTLLGPIAQVFLRLSQLSL